MQERVERASRIIRAMNQSVFDQTKAINRLSGMGRTIALMGIAQYEEDIKVVRELLVDAIRERYGAAFDADAFRQKCEFKQ